ncbi:CHAD domain-containing protein [bacterium]|nr:CHAD domain-containing protein [bacterium]
MLDQNLASMRNSPEGPKDKEVVHELRVTTKRLRAAWKMVSATVSPEFITRQKNGLRELSALLAEDRDLAVLIDLATKLHKNYKSSSFCEVVSFLNENVAESESIDSRPIVESLIDQEKIAWEHVQFSSSTAEQRCLRNAVRKSRSRARFATKLALKDSDSEIWHTWRKKVKQLRYQREFLAEIQHRVAGKFDARISRLGSLLGDRNDMANLTSVAKKMGNPGRIRKALAAKERRILGNCRRLGRRNLVAR